MGPQLVVVKGSNIGLSCPLIEKGMIVIGRSPSCNMVLRNDDRVSRIHCCVIESNGRYILEDTGSINGTYIGNTRIEKVTIEDGVCFKVGKNLIEVDLEGKRHVEYSESEVYPEDHPLEDTVFIQTQELETIEDQPLEGSVIGRYKIMERLDMGGMKDVHKALNIDNNNTVAMRVLSHNIEEEQVTTFKRLVEPLIALDHPHIIKVLETLSHEKTLYLISETFGTIDLDKWMAIEAPLNVKQALKLCLALCDALDYASKNGFIHQNLSPNDILYDEENGTIKVTNIGLLKILAESVIKNQDFVRSAYIAPEHVKYSTKIDIRCDIYAVGSILYHMLTGSTYFAEKSSKNTVKTTEFQHTPTPLSQVAPDTPDKIVHIVHKALSTAPEERYQNYSQMIQEIQSFLKGTDQV